MISKFFIERPRFAFVIAILMLLAGLIAIKSLPVAQYPNITPSTIQVNASYPGASAATVQQTVVEPIEAQLNGVKGMTYMSSTSSDTGAACITVTFGIGGDSDINTVNVQNRVNWANPRLPDEVRRQGVVVKEASPNMLLLMTLYSPNGTHDSLFLNNYADINIKDELARIPGVGDVSLLSNMPYAMRIWLDPDKLASLRMTIDEVSNAIKAQNVQVSAGAIGDSPVPAGQQFRNTLQTQGRLTSVQDFKNIVIRAEADGSQVRLSDVARVELGSETYSTTGYLNGRPAALLGIYQLADGNGLQIAKACTEKLESLKQYFPDDVAYGFQYDTTKFIKASIDEVVITLVEAVILVVLVTFLFMQDWRATIVPTVAIPVSLVGTFGVMLALGYSINLITLFGLILAIGIVVDDAILVIENVNRLMSEEGLSPKAAALKSMEQVTGPVISTTAVLLAMFVPVCFLPGITGEMYRQFGVTISVSVMLSALNALTLSPALSAMLLKPEQHGRKKFVFFRWFDAGFEKVTSGYSSAVTTSLRRTLLVVGAYAAILFACWKIYNALPTGFVPDEDQGAFFVHVQLPDGASSERTLAVAQKAEAMTRETEGVEDILTLVGFNIINRTTPSNCAMMIVTLKPWKERTDPNLFQDAIMGKIQGSLMTIHEAMASTIPIPAIPGLGTVGGFSFVVEDTTGNHPARMQEAVNSLLVAANSHPAIGSAFTTFRSAVPSYHLSVDREKTLKMGIPLTGINDALQGLMGYAYVNDFNRFGKVYKVQTQADGGFRRDIDNISSIRVKNARGEMAPLDTVLSAETRFEPQTLTRYNMYSSANVMGAPAPGKSTGEAMSAMESLAKSVLPGGMKSDWTDLSYQEKQAAGKMGMIFGLALLFIYLFLVAQYESWMIPFAVMLSVPVAFLGALLSLRLTGMDNNIYAQIGFVLLFGIASKTAILIVEFAKEKRAEGMPVFEAAVFAAKLRFRAVIMTALSFLLGVLPLVVATGAGSVSRRSLGTAIFGGMLMAAVLGTLLIPAFYLIVQKIIERCRPSPSESGAKATAGNDAGA